MTLRMGVVGVGHLGKEHARIVSGIEGVELVGVADVNFEQAQAVAAKHNTQAYRDYQELLDKVDAACIVAPTSLHGRIATPFLERGISLLVEKPIASNLNEAEALVDLAQHTGAILQIGHIERFNPAFEELQRRPLQPKWIRAQRVGPFTGRSTDIGVVLDLMIHDLDLLLTLVKSQVRSVEALGISVLGGHEDVANARLHFVSGCVADVTASRVSPVAQRTWQIWGPEGYAETDFGQRRVTLIQPSDAVRLCGLDPQRLDAASRSRLREDLFTRHLETVTIDGQHRDQLTAELHHFVDCVGAGRQPSVTGVHGRDALALAERILFAIEHHAWYGIPEGPKGPHDLPAPQGTLFERAPQRTAA
jgi:predicted dehydrogenase